MFIKQERFMDLVTSLGKAQGIAVEQAARISAQQASIDWFIVRITQLEKERAQLLFNYTGVKIEVPEIAKAPEPNRDKSLRDLLASTPNFEDLGDEMASKLGVGWNADGTLKTPALLG